MRTYFYRRFVGLLAVCLFWTASARAACEGSLITEFVLPTEGSWPQAITTGPDGNL